MLKEIKTSTIAFVAVHSLQSFNWYNNLTFNNINDLTRLIMFFTLILLHTVRKIGMHSLLYIVTDSL